jgi:hypothetical protein
MVGRGCEAVWGACGRAFAPLSAAAPCPSSPAGRASLSRPRWSRVRRTPRGAPSAPAQARGGGRHLLAPPPGGRALCWQWLIACKTLCCGWDAGAPRQGRRGGALGRRQRVGGAAQGREAEAGAPRSRAPGWGSGQIRQGASGRGQSSERGGASVGGAPPQATGAAVSWPPPGQASATAPSPRRRLARACPAALGRPPRARWRARGT